jgi:hypothetical protein
MVNQIWNDVISQGVARVPAPLPKMVWRRLYQSFASFVDCLSSHPELGNTFDQTAKSWQADSGFKLDFSGYFSPYYRNRTGQVGRDNKKVVQFCEPYYRYLCERAPELLAIPQYRSLTEGMMSALYSAFATYLPLVDALAEVDSRLRQALIPRSAAPAVALRLIRYESDAYYFTNPHVDKSALTVVIDSDEPSNESCLVFAPQQKTAPKLSEFKPAQREEGDALLFFGAAPREANHAWAVPAAHAVRPLQKPMSRNVAIFFWLLPGIDMSGFSTSTNYVNDLGSARPIIGDAA